MDAYTVFKFNFTFEVWVEKIAPDGVTSSQVYLMDGNGLLVPGSNQTYLYTKDALIYGTVLKEVKDPAGNVVFDSDRYVNSAEPVFTNQGVLNGYRQVIKREPPLQRTVLPNLDGLA